METSKTTIGNILAFSQTLKFMTDSDTRFIESDSVGSLIQTFNLN